MFNETILLNEAIQSLCPNSEYTFNDNDYSTIIWTKLEGDAPTQKQVDDEIAKIKAQSVVIEKERQRKREEILNRLGITQEEAKLLLS